MGGEGRRGRGIGADVDRQQASEAAERDAEVLTLAAAFARPADEAGGGVGDDYGGLDLVAVLPARPAGAPGGDAARSEEGLFVKARGVTPGYEVGGVVDRNAEGRTRTADLSIMSAPL